MIEIDENSFLFDYYEKYFLSKNKSLFKVVLSKRKRDDIWKAFISNKDRMNNANLKSVCPAIYWEIENQKNINKNIQSAIFSECCFSQTLANILELDKFDKYENTKTKYQDLMRLIDEYIDDRFVTRYLYFDSENSKYLLQGGGPNSVDAIYVDVKNNSFLTFEFKESYAKTSELDLPKYKDDGNIVITNEFIERHPNFKLMLLEKENINFFDEMGHNINNFSFESVREAINNNYGYEKKSKIICTEDKNSNLTLIKSTEISKWGEIVGEIRPAGRNKYNVWTPKPLRKFILEKGLMIEGDEIISKIEQLSIRKQRGSREISGYKINPLFYIEKKKALKSGNYIRFNINDIKQLNPTISAKMNFKNLDFRIVLKHYYNKRN